MLVLSGQVNQSSAANVRPSDGYKVRVAYSLAACRFLVGYMNVEAVISGEDPKPKPAIGRDSYNKSKQDEKWIRQKLGLAPR